MVNIIQNAIWNSGHCCVIYALHISGYSNFGGLWLNGQDSNNIYMPVGDLTIASLSINSIVLKNIFGYWEAMQLNSSGISMNTSLYLAGTTIFNKNISILGTLTCNTMDVITNELITGSTIMNSLLFVSGTTILNNSITCNTTLNVFGKITTSRLSVFINNNNLYNLSSVSCLNISGLNAKINSLSIFSYLNISQLNVNNNSLSNYSYFNISGLNVNIISLSNYSYLNISGLNANINSLSKKIKLITQTLIHKR